MRERTTSRRKRLKMSTMALIFFLLPLLSFASGARYSGGGQPDVNQGKMDQGGRNQSHEIGVKDSRGLFSPRMDYDQWKPLGRGDPLQNDPTYDYVPPVLERVHYWVEPPARKQDGPSTHEGKKSEILVLGVSSKKPSTSTAESRRDPYESFLKFMDGPKYHHHHNAYDRQSSGQRPPHSPHHNFHSQFFKNKFDDKNYKVEDQRMPYTVLVPPPVPPPHMEMPLFKQQSPPKPQLPPTTARPVYQSTTTAAPRPSVSVQQANLIYHSSTGSNNQWLGGNSGAQGAGSQYVTWQAPTDAPPNRIPYRESATKSNPIVFVRNSSENSNPQGAQYPFRVTQSSGEDEPYNLPLVFPTESVGRIVFEHHSTFDSTNIRGPASPTSHGIGSVQPGRVSSTPMRVPHVPLVLAPTHPALQVLHVVGAQPTVTHMQVGHQPMHKGQVSDDTIGNTYVNIGKPNAHIQKEVTTNRPTLLSVSQQPMISSADDAGSAMMKPMLQMPHLPVAYPNNQINSVYTNSMNRPAMINNGIPFSRRPGAMTDDFTMQTMQTLQPPAFTIKTTKKPEISVTKRPSGFFHALLQKETSTEAINSISGMFTPVTSTTPTPTTTVVASLTTDPLFKHYKQPNEPLRGPMYLIIQGHSKVKTYGAGNKDMFREASIPETNEIPQSAEKYPVKHLHGHKDNYAKDDSPHSRSKNSRTLKDLIDDGIGNIDIKETEVGMKYKVADEKTPTTSEKYYKGIVESEENDMLERQKLRNTVKSREKRQLEDFIPVMEDTVETYIYDFLKRQSEGSGVGAILASAITNDSSEDYDNNDVDALSEGRGHHM